jgi:hypothetical protein
MVNSFGPIMDARDSILDGHVKMHFEEIGFGFSFTFNTILFCRRLIGFVNNGSIRPIIGWIEA